MAGSLTAKIDKKEVIVKNEKQRMLGRVVPPPLFVAALLLIGFGLQWHSPVLLQNNHRAY